jgi:uncharacterized membrane protein
MKCRKTLEEVLPLAPVVALLLVGLWMHWPNVEYDGPADAVTYLRFVFSSFAYSFAYSDISLLYFQYGLWNHSVPYLDYPLEYPVGLGLLSYLLNLPTHTMPQYFLLTSLAMALSALGIALLVPRFPQGRLLLFALSPAVALYLNLNWDMWGVLLMVVALLLFVREYDDRLATAVLTIAVWTKFFPILFLPFLVSDRLRRSGRWAAGRIVVVFALASAAINVPWMLLAPAGWWYFFAFNAARATDWNLWTSFVRIFFDLSTPEINLLSALLVLGGLVTLFVLQWRLPSSLGYRAWLPAGCAMLACFFLVNKVYSPQYDLWIVVLLAVMGAAPALVVMWSAADLVYFTVVINWLRPDTNQQWFITNVLVPATALREVGLIIVIGWCVKQMHKPTPEHLQDSYEQLEDSPASNSSSAI